MRRLSVAWVGQKTENTTREEALWQSGMTCSSSQVPENRSESCNVNSDHPAEVNSWWLKKGVKHPPLVGYGCLAFRCSELPKRILTTKIGYGNLI